MPFRLLFSDADIPTPVFSYSLKLQLLNSLFWVSRDILMGGDEFALPKVTWQITRPTSWSVQMLVSSRAVIDDTVQRDEIYDINGIAARSLSLSLSLSLSHKHKNR